MTLPRRMARFLKKIMTSRHARLGVAAASLLESTIVPIPLELLLVPVMQADRRRIWQLAFAALAGCIGGALLGYAAGYFLEASLGDWIVSIAGGADRFAEAALLLRSQGFWFVFSVGVTPVPFQVAMVAAGASGYSLLGFAAATALSRFIRYFGLAALVWRFGDASERIYQTHRVAVLATVSALVIALWVLFGLVL